ncbi:hypothetical protein NEF87_002687 [Candidatus Lokiarchaeum ossiferum]|uniref:Guanylate cyclase domain-containing protein n=1 Tax=Candidatus Lokiarchaeum ossiferum TaxID=2951803 RepID=A0ABY6HVL5_9ARCH|nr:hypothetical protein NEF87_002687 [Candidatus Lokiarchaeum sp. B-35]
MVDVQLLNSFINKKKNPGKKNINKFPNDDEIAIGEVRTLNASIMVFDIANSSKYSEIEFIKYISPVLHMVFNEVSQNGGVVDKYTGDGAMISFCSSDQNGKWACDQALKTAIYISQLLVYFIDKKKFPEIKIRVGIDFGTIKVERIGIKNKSQLIIVGQPAIAAKRLESIGKKHASFKEKITICIGYDVFFQLSKEKKDNCEEIEPPFYCCSYFRKMKSNFQELKNYKIFAYSGRET